MFYKDGKVFPTSSSVMVSFEIPKQYTKLQYIESLFSREFATKKDKDGNYVKRKIWGWNTKDKQQYLSSASAFESVRRYSGNSLLQCSPTFQSRWGYSQEDLSLNKNIEHQFCLLTVMNDAHQILFHNDIYVHKYKKRKNFKTEDMSLDGVFIKITKIHLALFNHRQGVLIFHVSHSPQRDLNPDFLYNTASALRRLDSLWFLHKEASEKYITHHDTFGLGVLRDSLKPKNYNSPGTELNPIQFQCFINWLLVDQERLDNPPDIIGKYRLIYRQHHVLLQQEPSVQEKQLLLFYLSRGKLPRDESALHYQGNPDFEEFYHKEINHCMQITRESAVSLMWPSSDETPLLEDEIRWDGRFFSKYQLLLLQIIGEYLSVSELNFQGSVYAYEPKIAEDDLERLMHNMNYFQLGVYINDCGADSNGLQFYNNCRKVFDLQRLSVDLSNKVKDVYHLISAKQQQQAQVDKETAYRFQEQKEKERLAFERAKEKAAEEKEREREKAERRREKAEQRRAKKRDKWLTIISSITIPFAIGSGLMGMNNNREECSPFLEQWHYLFAGPDDDLANKMKGLVPCVSFVDFIIICSIFSALFGLYLWRRVFYEPEENPLLETES